MADLDLWDLLVTDVYDKEDLIEDIDLIVVYRLNEVLFYRDVDMLRPRIVDKLEDGYAFCGPIQKPEFPDPKTLEDV